MTNCKCSLDATCTQYLKCKNLNNEGNSNNTRSFHNKTKTCNCKLESLQNLEKAVIQNVNFEWEVIA